MSNRHLNLPRRASLSFVGHATDSHSPNHAAKSVQNQEGTLGRQGVCGSVRPLAVLGFIGTFGSALLGSWGGLKLFCSLWRGGGWMPFLVFVPYRRTRPPPSTKEDDKTQKTVVPMPVD